VSAKYLIDPVQLCASHTVPEAYKRQPPSPSQEPSRSHVDWASVGQLFLGSVPFEAFVQAPKPSQIRQEPQLFSGSLPEE
jgi:hypothetical protein